MKKPVLIILLVFLFIAVLFTAGCTMGKEVPSVLSITVTKDGGSTYCVGDTMTVNLPKYPEEGYDWYLVYSNGLSVDKKIVSAESLGISETSNDFCTFTFTPTEEGADVFVLKFMKKDDLASSLYDYTDTIFVDNSGGHTTSSFTFDGELIPSVGKYVDITIKKTASTVDETYAFDSSLSSNGLVIAKTTVVKSDLPGEFGSYTWRVTAKENGFYSFGVVKVLSEKDNELKFFVPLNFK